MMTVIEYVVSMMTMMMAMMVEVELLMVVQDLHL
jgi:hypothetical protein